MTVDVVYIAESVATGGGRDGHVKSADGKIDRIPGAEGDGGQR